MSIGYEGIALGIKGTDFIDCGKEISSKEKLMEMISHNLKSFERMLAYNHANQIGFYSIDSKLIPIGRHELLNVPWWEIYRPAFFHLGEKIREAKIRVSMDLSKTTPWDAMNEGDPSKSIHDLEEYAKIFKVLRLGTEHKMIIQIENAESGKKEGLERFKRIFSGLDKDVQARLALRNDENCCNIMDVIEIGKILHLPVVFHNRNHEANPSPLEKEDSAWIRACRDTWKESDGNQIVYYAERNSGKNGDSLADTIGIAAFVPFYESLDSGVDIMLEAEDRNLSAVKCINCIRTKKDIKALELEWRKYKYSVLENSHVAYLQIRTLLKEKEKYPAILFYTLIEEALEGKKRQGFVNAAQHVWGYFKKCATENEKSDFLMMMEDYKKGKARMEAVKKNLWELSVKYEMKYLLESYYFIL